MYVSSRTKDSPSSCTVVTQCHHAHVRRRQSGGITLPVPPLVCPPARDQILGGDRILDSPQAENFGIFWTLLRWKRFKKWFILESQIRRRKINLSVLPYFHEILIEGEGADSLIPPDKFSQNLGGVQHLSVQHLCKNFLPTRRAGVQNAKRNMCDLSAAGEKITFLSGKLKFP